MSTRTGESRASTCSLETVPVFAVVANGPHAELGWKALALPPGVQLTGFHYESEFCDFGGAPPTTGDAAVIALVVVRTSSSDADQEPWVWGMPFRVGQIADNADASISGFSIRLGPTIDLASSRLTRPLGAALREALALGHEDEQRSGQLRNRALHPNHPHLAGRMSTGVFAHTSVAWLSNFCGLDDRSTEFRLGSGSVDANNWRSAVRHLQAAVLHEREGWACRSEAPDVHPVGALRVATVERYTKRKKEWRSATTTGDQDGAVEFRRRQSYRVQMLTRWGSAQTTPEGRLAYSIRSVGPIAQVPSGDVEATQGGVARLVHIRPSDRRGPGQLQLNLVRRFQDDSERSYGEDHASLELDVEVVGAVRPTIIGGAAALALGVLLDLASALRQQVGWLKENDYLEFASMPLDLMAVLGIVLSAVGVALLTYGLSSAAIES